MSYSLVKLSPNAHALYLGKDGILKSDILNKCRRTWFVAFVGFFSLPFIKSLLVQTNVSFVDLLNVHVTFCIMHRHRKLITTKEAMCVIIYQKMLRFTAADTAFT